MKKPPPGPAAQLGSFLRSTWKQLDPVKEFVVQKSREGRRELDLALIRRKRKQALLELGEVTLKLVEAGKLDEDAFPDLSSALARLSEIEEELAGAPVPPEATRRAEREDEDDKDDEEDFLDAEFEDTSKK